MIEYLDDQQQRVLQRMEEPDSPNVFILWWAVGTGKTRVALAAFQQSDFQDLIVVTRRIAFGDWMDEIDLLGMKFRIFQNDYNMLNCLQWHTLDCSKRILFLSAGDLKNIPTDFPKGQMLVVDELYLFSNPKSKRSKFIKQMSLFCSARIGLSGTIMPARNNMAIYGQLRALNGHHPLGNTTTEFQERFQVRTKTHFGLSHINKPGSDQEITNLIQHRVDLYFPVGRPTRRQILHVDKTPAQTKAIKQLQELYEYKNVEYDYALQIVNVVNGISNGWWVDAAGNLVYSKSNKLDRLYALVDDLVAAGERVVVWCSYHNDIKCIAKELKHKWLEFTARVPFDISRWNSPSSPSVVLATEANGTSVNHFKDVKFAIYYSINYKLLDLEQSMGRHERKSSSHDGAHYYFLQTKGTIDAHTYYLVTQSKQTEKDLILTLRNEIPNL